MTRQQLKNINKKDRNIILCEAEDDILIGSVMGKICEEL